MKRQRRRLIQARTVAPVRLPTKPDPRIERFYRQWAEMIVLLDERREQRMKETN
jgi:hypothetical protein